MSSSIIVPASSDDQLKQRLTLLALGLIVGVGSYSIAKTLLKPSERSKKEQHDKQKSREIEKELKRTITGMSN